MNEITAREVDFALAILPYIGVALVVVCAAVAVVHVALAVAEFFGDCRKYTAWRLDDAHTAHRIDDGRRKR